MLLGTFRDIRQSGEQSKSGGDVRTQAWQYFVNKPRIVHDRKVIISKTRRILSAERLSQGRMPIARARMVIDIVFILSNLPRALTANRRRNVHAAALTGRDEFSIALIAFKRTRWIIAYGSRN